MRARARSPARHQSVPSPPRLYAQGDKNGRHLGRRSGYSARRPPWEIEQGSVHEAVESRCLFSALRCLLLCAQVCAVWLLKFSSSSRGT